MQSKLETASKPNETFRILPNVAFSFVAYFCIGVPLAILPSYVKGNFGIGATIAGLFISLQYIATFASRPYAGRLTDTAGPRLTVLYGLLACTVSGILLMAAAFAHHNLWLALLEIGLSRLALGVGESMGSTGALMWAIGRVGPQNTARVISWNGVATYTGLSLGAPLGAIIQPRYGLGAVGFLIVLIGVVSFVCALRMLSSAAPKAENVPLGKILFGVLPFGAALATGGMGFGVIAAFITLYFAHSNWPGAPLSLTIYGLSFVGARLLFAGLIDRLGGYPVAFTSFIVEAAGLLCLGLGHSQALAYLGCGLTGLGFSLIFPALGVEAANAFPSAIRGSVLGVYSAFIDLSLFLSGPIAGAMIATHGYSVMFLATTAATIAASAGTFLLSRSAISREWRDVSLPIEPGSPEEVGL